MDEAKTSVLDVPLLVSGIVRRVELITPVSRGPLPDSAAIAKVHVQNLATGNVRDLVSSRTRVAAWRLCLGQGNSERRNSNQRQRNVGAAGKSFQCGHCGILLAKSNSRVNLDGVRQGVVSRFKQAHEGGARRERGGVA